MSTAGTSATTHPRNGTGKVAHRFMREVNQALVLSILRAGDQMSRVELSRRSELSKPTISAIVEDLLHDGLVIEVGAGPTHARGGRPPSLLAYNERAEMYAGVQFGVNTTHTAVADGRGNVLAIATSPAVRGNPQRGIDEAMALVQGLLTEHRGTGTRLRAIGVSVPGLVEHDTGTCTMAPNLGWRDVPVRTLISDAAGCETVVRNSTVMAARAEGRHGAARDVESYVWVYAGTGIGAAVVEAGAVMLGSHGYTGEIGHCPVVDDGPLCSCGKRGCLETVASANAILARAADEADRGRSTSLAAGSARLSTMDLVTATLDGDPLAIELITVAGEHLGRASAYLANILNPALVVIGGPLAQCGAAYLEAIRHSFGHHTLAAEIVPVVLTQLGTDAPLLGAIQTASERHARTAGAAYSASA